MAEKVFQEEEVLSNVSTDHGIENVDGGDVCGTGLTNKFDENDCFLNVIIQSLWNLRRFRDEFLNCPTDHVHQGNPCVICALHGIFVALRNAKSGELVDPTSLRTALSDSNSERKFFQEGQMNDAAELLRAILNFLHKSFSSNFDISDTDTDTNTDTEEINPLGSWDCADSDCTAHSLFGMDVYEHMYCYHCSLESRHEKHSSFFHDVDACDIRTIKAKHHECSFDQLLSLVEMDGEVSCPLEKGGCDEKGKIQKYLSTSPYVFTIVLSWQKSCEDAKDIAETLEALAAEIDISVFYRGLDSPNRHCLVSVVCFYGHDYICFLYNHERGKWFLYNDQNVKMIGNWEDVCTMCESQRYQPHLLLYEASN